MFKKLYNSVCAEIKIDKKVRISVYLSVPLLYCSISLLIKLYIGEIKEKIEC